MEQIPTVALWTVLVAFFIFICLAQLLHLNVTLRQSSDCLEFAIIRFVLLLFTYWPLDPDQSECQLQDA